MLVFVDSKATIFGQDGKMFKNVKLSATSGNLSSGLSISNHQIFTHKTGHRFLG